MSHFWTTSVRTQRFLFACIILMVTACSSTQKSVNPAGTMRGQILVVGNEPFTRLALVVSADKSYLIACDDSTRQFLLSSQGKIAELVYSEIRKTVGGDEIEVLSAALKSQ